MPLFKNDDYYAGMILASNPQLMKQYIEKQSADKIADASPFVVGTPQQGAVTPYQMGEAELFEGEQPIQGLMSATEDYAPATGLFDQNIPKAERALRFNSRAFESGVPAFQKMAMANMQDMQQAAVSGGMGFGAGRRTGEDSQGNQFWVGNRTNKQTGQMETIFSPIGHANPEPIGGFEFTDNYGLTSDAKAQFEAQKAGQVIQERDNAEFYIAYIPETRAIEDGVYNIEVTQDLLQEMSGQTDYSSTGFGSWLKSIPLTDANRWESLKITIESRLAMDKMMELKQASATGSTGFGALSEKELRVLTSYMGELNQASKPADIKRIMIKIYNQLERTKTKYHEKMADNREKYVNLHKGQYGRGSPLPSFVQERDPTILDFNKLKD